MAAQPRLTLAPLHRRTLSLLYETLLITALLWFAGLLYAVVEQRIGSTHIRILYQIYLAIVAGVYFVWQWRRGQTLPMKTWRIRLVTRDGTRPRLGQAVGRYLFASVGLLLAGLGFVWALVDAERQFLHDRLAGTRLISD